MRPGPKKRSLPAPFPQTHQQIFQSAMKLPHLHSLKKVRLKGTRQVLPQVASSESLLFSCCPEGSSMRDFKNSTSNLSPRETSMNGEAISCSDTFCCVKHVFQQEVSVCGYCWVLCVENAQPNATKTWCLLTTICLGLEHHNCRVRIQRFNKQTGTHYWNNPS